MKTLLSDAFLTLSRLYHCIISYPTNLLTKHYVTVGYIAKSIIILVIAYCG